MKLLLLPASRLLLKQLAVTAFLALSLSQTTWAAGGPRASVSISPGIVSGVGEEATFTVSLSAPSAKPVALNFSTSGSAIPGRDYLLESNSFDRLGRIIIPAGMTSATITVITLDDDENFKHTRALIFTLLGGNNYSAPAPHNKAQLVIVNNF
jgi:hypothetical protein